MNWRNISRAGALSRAREAENPFVFVREDLDEARLRIGPVFQNPRGARTASEVTMAFEQSFYAIDVFCSDQRLQIHAGLVATPSFEVTLIVVYVSNAAAHARGEVAPS